MYIYTIKQSHEKKYYFNMFSVYTVEIRYNIGYARLPYKNY